MSDQLSFKGFGQLLAACGVDVPLADAVGTVAVEYGSAEAERGPAAASVVTGETIDRFYRMVVQPRATKLAREIDRDEVDVLAAADVARDAAIDEVEKNCDARWLERAYAVVVSLARERSSFTTDDVLAVLGEDLPREPRVVGAVMRRAKREGIVEPHGYAASSRVESHARPKRVWHSLVAREPRP